MPGHGTADRRGPHGGLADAGRPLHQRARARTRRRRRRQPIHGGELGDAFEHQASQAPW
jgi:hypothetical protein